MYLHGYSSIAKKEKKNSNPTMNNEGLMHSRGSNVHSEENYAKRNGAKRLLIKILKCETEKIQESEKQWSYQNKRAGK
jgi:myosin-crossreactive antigen